MIGIYEISTVYNYKILIYPNRYTIKKDSLGIFITYDGGDYVDKLLKFFEDNNQVDYNQFTKRNTKLNINQQDMRQMLNRIFRKSRVRILIVIRKLIFQLIEKILHFVLIKRSIWKS